ncbi:MAG: ZIP family metal transporter [Ichthyobacteriaceae bacterium]|nr:ZIP family metal transporter [Ichthyobacteriaceae bacterium]
MSYIILFMAVVIGAVIGELIKPYEKIKKLFLTFSGAFLLAVTVFHLLPGVYKSGFEKIGLYIMIGVFIQLLLEYISNGMEHAHQTHNAEKKNHSMFTIPMYISISIHAFLEGAPVAGHEHTHLIDEISNPILMGIFIHKIPIASIIYSAFRESGRSKTTSIIYLALFGLMSPLGSFLANNIPLLLEYKAQINAIVIGIFLHISTTILFESSSTHKFNYAKLTVIAFATTLVYFSY